MSTALRVVAAGPLTILQDGGRGGWLRFGVASSGALDPRALAVANLLVGNRVDEGTLEMTLAGGTFAAEDGPIRIAIAGADMPLAIDGIAAAPNRSHTLAPGAVLRIGAARSGARAYLAVSGGFVAAPVFGSVATHLRSGIGGHRLRDGDLLPLLRAAPAGPEHGFVAAVPPAPAQLRIILGPQQDFFTDTAVATLLEASYTVAARSDRMGLRLEGPRLAHQKGFNILSDGIAPGSIQVPGGGQPIILLADRQTTGGYPKIATVISADVPALGQARPGDIVRFRQVTLDEAIAARRAHKEWLDGLPARIVPLGALDSECLLTANLISGVTDGA